MNISLTLFLDVWVTRLKKTYSYDFLEFQYQYGTESELTVAPITITQSSSSLLEADPPEFRSTSPQLIAALLGG
ncbi:MAG: hypothetical protein R3F11_05945 [Verrucomicrobiales bacterium]